MAQYVERVLSEVFGLAGDGFQIEHAHPSRWCASYIHQLETRHY